MEIKGLHKMYIISHLALEFSKLQMLISSTIQIIKKIAQPFNLGTKAMQIREMEGRYLNNTSHQAFLGRSKLAKQNRQQFKNGLEWL